MSYTKELTWKHLQKYDSVMGLDMSADYLAAYIMGQKKFNVGLGLINQWEEALAIQKAEAKKIKSSYANETKGKEYEKAGNTKAAIRTYEKNLVLGQLHPIAYDRLIILYRKEKDLDNEIRVLTAAIELFRPSPYHIKKVEKWQERLDKLTIK